MKILRSNLSFLRQFSKSQYCDVKLSTQDGAGDFIAAHRVVLVAVSVKLDKLIDAGEGAGPVVVRNIKFEVLKKIVEFIYLGRVQMRDSDDENEDFQDGLDMLRVKVSHCKWKTFLIPTLSLEMFITDLLCQTFLPR